MKKQRIKKFVFFFFWTCSLIAEGVFVAVLIGIYTNGYWLAKGWGYTAEKVWYYGYDALRAFFGDPFAIIVVSPVFLCMIFQAMSLILMVRRRIKRN